MNWKPHLLAAALAVIMALSSGSAHAQLSDVTQPGDPIVATSNNSPGAEGVANAIDNQPAKYLNFDKLNTGFTVTPSAGRTLVQGLTLTSANDAPERDPASFRLEGSDDGAAFSLIASNSVAPFPSRSFTQTISFLNDTSYLSYRLIFPTVANAATANSMQISEVELLGVLCICAFPHFTNCPSGYTVPSCGATTNFVYPKPGADNFGSCPLTVTCTPPSGFPFPVGPTIVTCTAKDCTGQMATCKFTVTVIPDTTPPAINCACLADQANELLTITNCLGFVPDLCQFTNCFSDNCCLQSCSQSPVAGTPVGPGTYPITVTIKDCAGNSSAPCVVKFVVAPPPGGCDTNCLDVLNEHLVCVTNVPGKLNYSFDLQNNSGVPVKYLFLVPKTNCFAFMPDILTFNPPLPPGQTATVSTMIKVTGNCPTNLCFIVAAHNSNLVQCCSIMHCVTNPALPTIICPTNIVVDCDADTGALVKYAIPTATSPCCPGPVLVTCTPPPGLFPIGVTQVTCSAIDSCTNSVQCCFSVTVLGKGSGQWTWARQAGGPGSDSGNAVAVDGKGNIYVTGSFENSMTFPGGPTLTGFGGSGSDIFLAKYNSAGMIQWAVRAGGTGQDAGSGVAVDQSGNVYLTGTFEASAAFESYPSTPAFNLTSLGGADIFVAKYDPNGGCLWSTRDGSAVVGFGLDDASGGVAVTPNGNDVYVVGNWQVPPPGGVQVFLRRVNGITGALVGAPFMSSAIGGGTHYALGDDVTLDAAGRVYVAGGYYGTTMFGFNTFPAASSGYVQTYVASFSPSLTPLWARHSGNNSGAAASCSHIANGIALDPSGQWCYIAGHFNGTANFGNNGFNNVFLTNTKNGSCPNQLYDYFLAKFDALSGLPVWIVNGNGAATENAEAHGIAMDPSGNPCIIGFLHPNAPDPFVNEGSTVLVASYNPAGALLWMDNPTDGSGPPNTPSNRGLGIAVDLASCVHVTGAFTEDLNFLPLTPSLLSAPDTVFDMFVAKRCPVCQPACPPKPVLTIVLNLPNIVISWSGPGYHLQCTSALANPSSATVWVNVPGTSPVTLPAAGPYKFFRLVSP